MVMKIQVTELQLEKLSCEDKKAKNDLKQAITSGK